MHQVRFRVGPHTPLGVPEPDPLAGFKGPILLREKEAREEGGGDGQEGRRGEEKGVKERGAETGERESFEEWHHECWGIDAPATL